MAFAIGSVLVAMALAAAVGVWRLLSSRPAVVQVGLSAAPLLGLPPALMVVAGGGTLMSMLTGSVSLWLEVAILLAAVPWGIGSLLAVALRRWPKATWIGYLLLVPVTSFIVFLVLASTVHASWNERGVCLPPGELVEYSGGDGTRTDCDLPPG